MIATLPMYLAPDNIGAHDAYWALIRDGLRARGIAAPDALNHTLPPMEGWAAPDLVLSQICNLPYRTMFRDRVTRIGASDYGLEDCEPGHYRSLFVVRGDHPATRPEDLDGATLAYNEAESQSGWGALALWSLVAGIRIRPVLRTGAHRLSMLAVARGDVEFATIDAQSFATLSRTMPEVSQLRIIGATPTSPGQSYITRAGEDPEPYREAISEAIQALATADRELLGLRAVVPLSQAAYELPIPPSPEDLLAQS